MHTMQLPEWGDFANSHLDPLHVHLWMSRRRRDDVHPAESGLTAAERHRCDHFRFESDRARCQARRGLLRRVLSRYLNCPPGDVELTTSPNGKPAIAGSSRVPPLGISISASQDVVLVGVGSGLELGVDVECVRELPDLELLARHALGADELTEMSCCCSDDLTRWLLRRWTAKEAILKASGEGLLVDPRSVKVGDLEAGGAIGHMNTADRGDHSWFVSSITLGPDVVAAVACDRQAARICCFQDAW